MTNSVVSFLKTDTLVPLYLQKFNCVGSNICVNSCCQKVLFFPSVQDMDGMAQLTNQTAYQPWLRLAFGVAKNKLGEMQAFSRMNPVTGQCWLLDRQQKCRLYDNPALPTRCAEYPAINRWLPDGVQQFLSPSCPEVGRLLWKTPDALALSIAPVLMRQESMVTVDLPEVEQQRYLLLRQAGATLLQTRELPLSRRLMLLYFLTEQISDVYEANQVDQLALSIDSLFNLIQQNDETLHFTQITFDESLHALLLVKLLQLRHDRQQGVGSYEKVLNDVVLAFDLADQSRPLEERALAAIPRIREALADLDQTLLASPHFLEHIVLNHWLAYAFPVASVEHDLRINMLAFLLFYLLQRLFLAAAASAYGNDFEQQACLVGSAFHREWVEESPMLFAAAMSLANSELKSLPKLLSLLEK